VTKAVGDFLGTNGMADEMIWFNGFPFLEREDHAYNVTGEDSWIFPGSSRLIPLISVKSDEKRLVYYIWQRDERTRCWCVQG